MRPFSSSILSDSRYNGSSTALNESTSLNAIKEVNEPMLYKLLQFDEAVARADIDATRDFYVKMLDLVNSKKDTVDYDPAYMAVLSKLPVRECWLLIVLENVPMLIESWRPFLTDFLSVPMLRPP